MEENAGRLRQQQALLATFGSFAFRGTNLQAILEEAARVCALSLGAERAKICQYRAEQNDLLIVAGFGWHDGIVGQVVSRADESSPQGRAYITGQPVICNNLAAVSGLTLPRFYAQHHVVSTVDVIIKSVDGPPFGILEIDNTSPHQYDEHDIDFLTGFANVLAEAVATASRVEGLRLALARIQNLVVEKDQLIADRNVMAEELQHRVRNNLQLVAGMLAEQLNHTPDANSQSGLRGIQSRVTALAKVYDHLLGIGLSRTIDFAEYARQLSHGLPDLQPDEAQPILLSCDVAPMMLDLNVVTALGLAVSELVANSYRHAFPLRRGRITIAGGPAEKAGWGELKIGDDGIGYKNTSRISKRRGVGLVFRLMEQISGSAELQAGSGTAWTLTFPLSPDEPAAAGPQVAASLG
jgi:two-component sensor histidine kinase